MNAYQAFSQRLFAIADYQGLPLSGTFELTPRCNFNCKMCYIHRAETDVLARTQEKSAAQWLALAEDCCRAGTLLLLLTGGEPLLRPDFRDIYSGCKQLGLMLSINTNASLMDGRMVDFLAADPPARVNITLYGASAETYGALCGVPAAYDRVVQAILRLKEAGILVKLNFSVTPWNRHDAQKVYDFAAEHAIGLQAASYMFPPVRACEHGAFCSERLTPQEAAAEKVRYERARFPEADCKARWRSPAYRWRAARLPRPGRRSAACGTRFLSRRSAAPAKPETPVTSARQSVSPRRAATPACRITCAG